MSHTPPIPLPFSNISIPRCQVSPLSFAYYLFLTYDERSIRSNPNTKKMEQQPNPWNYARAFIRLGTFTVGALHLLMQPQTHEQALFAIQIIRLIRAQRNRWHRIRAWPLPSRHYLHGNFPFTPSSSPNIWDLAAVTEVLVRTHSSELMRIVM